MKISPNESRKNLYLPTLCFMPKKTEYEFMLSIGKVTKYEDSGDR